MSLVGVSGWGYRGSGFSVRGFAYEVLEVQGFGYGVFEVRVLVFLLSVPGLRGLGFRAGVSCFGVFGYGVL